MTRTLITTLAILTMLMAALDAFAQEPQPLTTLVIRVDRASGYTLQAGDSAGELVLSLENPPADAIAQLEKQFSKHFVALKVMERGSDKLVIKLIVLPIGFRYRHQRLLNPHAVEISILAPRPEDRRLAAVPDVPPMPFWEMLNENSVILPPERYSLVKGNGDAHQNFMAAVKLYKIGAHEAAIVRLRQNLSATGSEFWDENLMLLADVLFQQALMNRSDMTEARKALIAARQQTDNPIWKSRAQLLLGYAGYMDGLRNDAAAAFTEGEKAYPELVQYFQLGLLQVATTDRDRELMEKLIESIELNENLSEPAERKVCFLRAVLALYEADVMRANKIVDGCMENMDRSEPLAIGHWLILAEIRLLSHRYGEAKEILQRVLRDFPDNPNAALAGMRIGDVYQYERRFDEAGNAYNEVVRRWSDSVYARLSELKARELSTQITGTDDPLELYKSLDLHHEPEPVGREVRLRFLWNYENSQQDDMAYIFLVELMRRYDGKRYWGFAPTRFTNLVLKGYRRLADNNDFLTLISLYQARTPFPLDHASLDKIAMMVADAYSALGQFTGGAVDIYLEALNRPERPVDGERELLLGLTEAYLATGDLYRASKTQDYFRSRFATPEDSRDYFFMLGEIEQSRGNIDAALIAFQKAMALVDSPTQRRLLGLKIGRVFYRQKLWSKAVEALQPALANYMDPDVLVGRDVITLRIANAIFWLADSYYKLGQYQNALHVYTRILRLMPEDERIPIAHYFAASCQWKLENSEGALAHFAKLAEMDDPFWKQIGEMKTDISEWSLKHQLKAF